MDGEVRTIFVAGLPSDATYRELENTVRFFPGYEALKISSTRGKGGGASMFVKFDSTFAANGALKVLNGVPFDTAYPDVPMRVEIAKTDMKTQAATPYGTQPPPPTQCYTAQPPHAIGGRGVVTPPIGASLAGAPPPAAYDPYAYGAAPAAQDGRKRPRGDQSGMVDTIVLLGQVEKGFTEAQLEDFFRQVPGFVAFKANSRVGGAFVKFSSPHLAQEAIEVAAQSGVEAQFARSSMNVPPGGGGGDSPGSDMRDVAAGWTQPPPPAYPPSYQPTYPPAYVPPPSGGGSAPIIIGKNKRNEDPGTVDTLALLGAIEKGYTEKQLEDFFAQIPGFIAFKASSRVGGGFVKFASPQMAASAKEIAIAQGVDAQIARSSMNL